MATVNEKMTAIANAIREKTYGNKKLTLDDMAAEIPKVYDAGYEMGDNVGHTNGYNAGYNCGMQEGWAGGKEEGYAEGEESMNEDWWIAISNNYKRIEWAYAFQGADIRNIGAPQGIITVKNGIARMFQSCITGDNIPTFFDCSGVTTATHAFRYSTIKVFVDLNIPAITVLNGTWQSCRNLETIEIIRCLENTNWDATFSDCPKLKDVTFEGVIGTNIHFGDCSLLSKETLLTNGGDGVFGKLKDYSGTGTTHTITLHADTKAMLTDAEKAIATQKGWTIA